MSSALICIALLSAASPQDDAPVAPVPAAEPSAVVQPIETQADEAHQIGLMLRCPVCQGMPIAESPSEMAQDMMKRIRAMLDAGKSRQEVLDYFVGKYGEWVLLQPKAEGMNLGLWLLPIAALIIGALLVVRGMRQRGEASETGAAAKEAEDDYLRAVRDEVDR